jgi:hypothetical protein
LHKQFNKNRLISTTHKAKIIKKNHHHHHYNKLITTAAAKNFTKKEKKITYGIPSLFSSNSKSKSNQIKHKNH